MIHDKRYLQFNDLVFDGYDMISSEDETTNFKGNSTPYSYGHGSYFPLKDEYLYVQEKQVSMVLKLYTKKVPCDYREFYVRFAEQELVRAGRLWAIKNNEIIWAYAHASSVHQIISHRPNEVEYDIEFTLPEGIWHKADKQRTFVLPYNVCTFMECKGYEKYDPCMTAKGGDDCCEACAENRWYEDMRERCFCCCVDEITADMALCYHQGLYQALYGCDTPFQLVYSCEHAEKFKTNAFIGHKMCKKDICDDNMIAGQFYSDTDLPTQDVTVILTGKMKNPEITINGNMNIIKGEYDGSLIIDPSGDVSYTESECCDPTLLDPSVWEIPSGNDYGWRVYPMLNSVIVNTNACCGMACVFVDADAITI